MENTSIILKVESVITDEDNVSIKGKAKSKQNDAIQTTSIFGSGKAVNSHTNIIRKKCDNEFDASNSKTDHNVKDNDSVTFNRKAVPSTDHNKNDNDSVASERKAVQSTDHNINDNDPVTSNSETISCTDHSINDKKSMSLSIAVTSSASSQRPDTILFIVINTQNNKCVSTLVPYKMSRQLAITGNFCQMAVHAYGLQRKNNHAMEWYRVLSHSHHSTEIDSSLEQTEDSRTIGISRVQMPALVTSDIRNCLPFHTKKTIPANIIQDKWQEDQYTLTRVYRTNDVMFIQQMSDGTTSILIHKPNKDNTIHVVIPFPLPSATDFEVHVMKGTQQSGSMLTSCVPTEKISFRTKMAQKDVFELYTKCLRYLLNKYPRFHWLPYLYRNKSPEYFRDILWNNGGWMKTYIKNNGGDPASVLNGTIKGLFFSAVLQENTGLPPPFSPFGSARLFVPTLSLFNKRCNLYFADFYCHSTQRRHKVQLVLTLKGTDEDIFCQQRLVYLDPYCNPIFYKQVHPHGNGVVRTVVTLNVIVEIFLTNDVNIRALPRDCPFDVFIEENKATTSGRSMIKGLPKCSSCNVCNLSRFCS